jgi:hypothetical protein
MNHGKDWCRVCGFATTFSAGKPPICGLQHCQDVWRDQHRDVHVLPVTEKNREQSQLDLGVL